MANALRQEQDGSELEETADFIEKMDQFFDCLNVSSLSGGNKHLKTNRYPYRSSTDERLTVSIINFSND